MSDDRTRLTALPGGEAAPSKKGPTQPTLLVSRARARYELVHADDEAFALPKSAAPIARSLRGHRRGSLRRELLADYLDQHGAAPSASSMQDALATLEALAMRGREISPALRVGRGPDGQIVLDLGRDDGLAAIVEPGSWRLETSPIVFRRTPLTRELPIPTQPGDLEGLWGLVHVSPDDRPLLRAYLVAALFTGLADNPIFAFFGEAGAGKTTAARATVELLDPSPVPLRAAPGDVTDWVVAASGSWVVGVDNLSRIEPWFSDALCRASSGEGLIRRRLHTDDEISIIALKRFVVLTSIDVGAMRGDFADRLIRVELERLTPGERRSGEEVARLLEEQRADLLGGLLTLTAEVLAELPKVETTELPRLTDFGRIVAAVDQVTGSNGFERLAGLEERLAQDVVEGEFVGVVVMRKLDALEADGQPARLEGTATELKTLLQADDENLERRRDWPKTPKTLSERLRRLAPSFRALGIDVEFEREKRRRFIRIEKRAESASSASSASPAAWLGDKDGDAAETRSVAGDAEVTQVTQGDAAPEARASTDFSPNHAASSAFDDAGDAGDGVTPSTSEEGEAWITAAREANAREISARELADSANAPAPGAADYLAHVIAEHRAGRITREERLRLIDEHGRAAQAAWEERLRLLKLAAGEPDEQVEERPR
jgi:hypothetical protein